MLLMFHLLFAPDVLPESHFLKIEILNNLNNCVILPQRFTGFIKSEFTLGGFATLTEEVPRQLLNWVGSSDMISLPCIRSACVRLKL